MNSQFIYFLKRLFKKLFIDQILHYIKQDKFTYLKKKKKKKSNKIRLLTSPQRSKMNVVQHAQFTYLYGKSGDTFQALFTQGKQGYMSRNYK